MEIIKIAVLILTVVIISAGLSTGNKEIAVITTICCCIVVLLYVLKMTEPAIDYIKIIAERLSFDNLDIILKAVGIGLITQFVSDTAIDCGNKALANQMVFAGRICVLVVSIPAILEVLKIVENLMDRV